MRTMSRDNFLSEWPICGQHKFVMTKRLPSLLSCELPGPSRPLAQDGLRAPAARLALGSHIFGAPFWIKLNVSPVNLSYVDFIIRPAKEPRRKEGSFASMPPALAERTHVPCR